MIITNDIIDSHAEGSVIATLISHPEFQHNVSYLRDTNFYDPINQCFHWAIRNLIENGVENIDAVNLSNQINTSPGIQKIMSEYNINNLSEFVEASKIAARDTLEEYKLLVDTVVSLSFKRDLAVFSTKVEKSCHDKEIKLSELNDYVNNGLTKITDRYIFGADSVLFGEKIDDVWSRIESKRNSDGTYGLPFKIPQLNDYATLAAGDLILVVAKTGAGKSAYFLNETLDKLQRGVCVLYIDTELDDEVFLKRSVANLSGVEYKRVENGNYGDDEARSIERALQFMRNAKIIHEYVPDDFSKSQIEQMCRKWQIQENLGLVIYDYMKPDDKLTAAELANQMGKKCDFFKNTIAGKLKLPVIAGAQLNNYTDKIADSDKLSRYASTVMKWRAKTREEVQQDGLACGNFCFEIGKNRNGMSTPEGDYIDCMFDGAHQRIEQAERHEILEVYDDKSKKNFNKK